MAYHFTIGNYSVYIDAATGEDIAYSEKRMVARAFSADGEGAFPNHKNRQQMQRHALMSLDIQPMNRALAHSII